MKLNKKKGFTLAEVLITLSIIGVIAAILFPSILADYNERTLKAKRQAFIARMSQAMGEMADTFRNYASVKNRNQTESEGKSGYIPNCTTKQTDCVDDGSALKFISEGLSKVYQINAVCDVDTLSACDIPSSITLSDGTLFSLNNAKSWTSYNKQIVVGDTNAKIPFDLETAALRTKNGESVLVWYNPNCSTKTMGNMGASIQADGIFVTNLICVNLLYDLNGGKNKPNKTGEDIGFMSVFYNDTPFVVSPKPYDWRGVADINTTTNSSGETITTGIPNPSYYEAKSACAALGNDVRLPALEEGMSMLFNRELWAPQNQQNLRSSFNKNQTQQYMYTSTWINSNKLYEVVFASDGTYGSGLPVSAIGPTGGGNMMARCVYDN